MRIKFSAFILLVLFAVAKFTPSVAQNAEMKWATGIGWNAVDDHGQIVPSFGNLMYVPFPSTIHIARFLGHGVSLDAAVCYNKYANGKIINGIEATNVTNSNSLYFSFDANLKYDLYEFALQLGGHQSHTVEGGDNKFHFFKYFDPYVLFGYGYTYRAYTLVPGHTTDITNNLGLGFNVWIKYFLGINIQAAAKFRMMNEVSNYVQFSAGVIYRFPRNVTKESDKKVNLKI